MTYDSHTEATSGNEQKQPPLQLMVTHAHACPMYSKNDLFELDHQFLLPPPSKSICLTLTTAVHNQKVLIDKHKTPESDWTFMCHGCKVRSYITVQVIPVRSQKSEASSVMHMLHQYSFFRLIPEPFLESLYNDFAIEKFAPNEIIIEQGTPPTAVYMVISGEVEVLTGKTGAVVAHHGSGGIFGEMSVICKTQHNATVRSTTESRILKIKAETFAALVLNSPALLRYFYQLLSKRLNRIYLLAAKNDGIEIHGKLSEWPLPDLLQTINMNHKTGVLELQFESASASVEFLNGNITGASHLQLVGSEALYALFKESEGVFNFIHSESNGEIADRGYTILGDFMSLMMEGLVRADESNQLRA